MLYISTSGKKLLNNEPKQVLSNKVISYLQKTLYRQNIKKYFLNQKIEIALNRKCLPATIKSRSKVERSLQEISSLVLNAGG